MPIRTNRGRAAVYRRLWGWPLRSPRHLVVALVVVVVLAIAVAVVTAHANKSTTQRASGGGDVIATFSTSVLQTPSVGVPGLGAPATTGATTGGTSGAPSATRLISPTETPKPAAAAPAALAVINAWGKEWVNHPIGMTNAQWLAQLKPYTTSEFLPQMSTVDVSNIDATEVTGAPTATKSFTSSVEALLPTNAGKLDITAISTPQGWQVSAYTEAS
jgi:hypothetical protein